ncbi:hypothetical protein IMSHALPRED_007503 [Imshaugia aleurites]|uniref:Uncharacterized protein n=1 Tax=Imshaugia aleurites TaxID=172621 RepID=A0A8H3HZD7_9LECA|nr:hypothetical protein IMSHALPRED_007503 [Imshaugia aleurites]
MDFHTPLLLTRWKKSLLIRLTAKLGPVLLKQTAREIGPDHDKGVVNNRLVSTSERSGIMKRMQRLGIQLAGAPDFATGLVPDEETPSIHAHLWCSFLRHSGCSHDYGLDAIGQHYKCAISCFLRVHRPERYTAVIHMIPYKEHWLALRGSKGVGSIAIIIDRGFGGRGVAGYNVE